MSTISATWWVTRPPSPTPTRHWSSPTTCCSSSSPAQQAATACFFRAARRHTKRTRRSLKRYLIIGALLVSAITSSFAQSNIDAFFHANPYLDFTQQAAYAQRQIGYVGYRLINPSELEAIDRNYQNQGCVRLGISSWRILPCYGGGMPDKEATIYYARSIGADLVLYILEQEWGSEYYDHTVYFYASKSISRKAR